MHPNPKNVRNTVIIANANIFIGYFHGLKILPPEFVLPPEKIAPFQKCSLTRVINSCKYLLLGNLNSYH